MDKFLSIFRTNVKSDLNIIDGKKRYFNYALSQIESERKKKLVPNFDNWYKNTFGTSYKNNNDPSLDSLKNKIEKCFTD